MQVTLLNTTKVPPFLQLYVRPHDIVELVVVVVGAGLVVGIGVVDTMIDNRILKIVWMIQSIINNLENMSHIELLCSSNCIDK